MKSLRLIVVCLFLVLAVGCGRTKTKTKPALPSGTEVEVIDGHEYLTSESWTLLGGWNISSRTHKINCKFCKGEEYKGVKK